MTPIDFTTPPPSESTTTAAEYRDRVRVYLAVSSWARADLLAMMTTLGRGGKLDNPAAVAEYRAFRDAITSRGFISQDVQAIVMDELRGTMLN